jgi:hypothetical protein
MFYKLRSDEERYIQIHHLMLYNRIHSFLKFTESHKNNVIFSNKCKMSHSNWSVIIIGITQVTSKPAILFEHMNQRFMHRLLSFIAFVLM